MEKYIDNIWESQLARDNRMALVEALQSLGFSDVSDETPLSELAEYMRWSGGLRDLRLATINKQTGKYADYSEEEWAALSASGKAGCVKIGLRIRARTLDFIISKEDLSNTNGSKTMTWCANTTTNVKGLTNYASDCVGMLSATDYQGLTDLIVAYAAENNIRFDAAQCARSHKASTLADGGFEDPTVWSLPVVNQLVVLYIYFNEINDALKVFFGTNSVLERTAYWTPMSQSAANAWFLNTSPGYFAYTTKTGASRVRAVAPVPTPAKNPS